MEQFRKIKEIIEQYDKIVLYRHINGDYDAYGSQLGLKNILQDNYPDKKIYAVGTDDIHNTDLLDPLDELPDEEIEECLAIITDCSTGDRITDDRWKKAKYSIRIDHHPFSYAICDYEIIDTDASSAAQLVCELALDSKWNIPKHAAELLYAGMSADTVKFSIDKVDDRLFSDLAQLKKYGFNINDVNRKVYDIDRDLFNVQTLVRSKIIFNKNSAYLYITLDNMKEWNLDLRDAKDFVNLMSNIKGVDKYASFIENDNHTYSVSLRAHKITISDIAIKFGGGGHLLASGISEVTFEQTKEIIDLLANKE